MAQLCSKLFAQVFNTDTRRVIFSIKTDAIKLKRRIIYKTLMEEFHDQCGVLRWLGGSTCSARGLLTVRSSYGHLIGYVSGDTSWSGGSSDSDEIESDHEMLSSEEDFGFSDSD